MSISNLFEPNDYNLFCNDLTANNLTFTNTSITTLNVDNINENTLNHGIILQGNINVSNTGVVTFPQSNTEGIILPAVGGTQALLNAYESFSTPVQLINIWNSPINTTLNVVRIGNIVNMTIVGQTAQTTKASGTLSFIGVNYNIPSRLQTTNNTSIPIEIMNNAIIETGTVALAGNGIAIYRLPATLNYNNNALAGLPLNVTFTYSLL